MLKFSSTARRRIKMIAVFFVKSSFISVPILADKVYDERTWWVNDLLLVVKEP
jgi:hypothetical protein